MAEINDVKRYLNYTFSYWFDYPFTHPKEVNFQVTNRCPLRCVMCNIPKLKSNKEELSLERMKGLIDEVVEWGPKHVSFVGGEALVRRQETIELVRYAASRGLHTTIVSNGHFLDKTACRQLLDAGLKRLALSLDGAKRQTHDFIRGKGNYDKVINAMMLMLKMRLKNEIKLDFSTVVMSHNFREIVDIYHLAKRMGVDQIFFQALVPDNTYKIFDCNSEPWIGEKYIQEFKNVVKQLVELKKADSSFIFNTVEYLETMPKYFEQKENFRPGICLAGYTNLNIDPYGNIGICGIGPNLNVNGGRLNDLWKDERYKKTRQMIKKCRRPCLMLCWEKLGIKGMFELLTK